jgi:hypothetical protein
MPPSSAPVATPSLLRHHSHALEHGPVVADVAHPNFGDIISLVFRDVRRIHRSVDGDSVESAQLIGVVQQ